MEHTFLTEAVALVVSGAIIAYLCFRLGLVPIVGFLVAGVVIGPNALGLVNDRELVDAAAEVGVMFLLFTIGIEFSLEKLSRIKGLIFGGGGLQVVGASLAIVGLLAVFGVDWRAALFTGFLVALSSTAIVLKLLADRGETNAPHGQVALGLLIFQDLAVVVMVLLVPMLAGAGESSGSGTEIAWALGKAGAIIVAVLLVARRVMPQVLEMVARTCSEELFLLTVITICAGTAYLTNLAGVSLSLGAFLAGLVVSESRFSEHAMSEILPLQILFSAIFFVSVGMLLDLRFLVTSLPLVVAALVAVVVVKVGTTFASVRLLGYPTPVALASGLMLAQVGEFSFVLERAGREMGLWAFGIDGSGSQVFIASTVVLMVLTPLLTSIGGRIAARGERPSSDTPAEPQVAPEGVANLENHVVVAGFGEAARRLVRVLHGSSIPYVITTLSPHGATEAEHAGHPVLLGDSTRPRTLQLAGVERAKMLVVPDDDPATARRIVAIARTVNPTMRILVRTRYIAEVEPLAEEGSDRVIADELESVVQLFADVMRAYAVSSAEIEANEAVVRSGGYAALRDSAPAARPIAECHLGPDCLDRRAVTIRAGSPAAGQTIAALQLWERFRISVEWLHRDGMTSEGPSEDTVLRAGDEISMASSAAGFADAAPLFRVGELSVEESSALDAAADRRVVDVERRYELESSSDGCAHVAETRSVFPTARGCEDCMRIGARWVHLRLCFTCGHVGCCDSSPHRHASAHFHATRHPIMRSLEPGEDWAWCFVDELTL